MTSYTVTARRSGDWWALEVPDLPGVFSQAKRLSTADSAAREAIAAMLDTEAEGIEVTLEVVLPDAAVSALEAVDEAKARAERASREAQRAAQAAAAALTQTLSQRDAGKILGVSFQRISQMLKEAEKDAADDGPVAGMASQRGRRSGLVGTEAAAAKKPRKRGKARETERTVRVA